AMPALPGRQKSFFTSGERLIFQHKACSRPPEPMTRMFIVRRYEWVMIARTMPEIEPTHNQQAFTVSEISSAIKRAVESGFGYVRVRGEISGFKLAASGHAYMTLKDDAAVLDAVCWKGTV